MAPLLLLVLSSVFAASVGVTGISAPASGTYWKNDSHNIVFTVFATDVNGEAGQADLNVEVYYSSSAGDYSNLIGDFNLVNTSYCGSVNDFNNAGVQCTIPWTMSISSDGNYYIDLNVYTHRAGSATGDTNKISSSSFYADNTVPSYPKSFAVEQLTNSSVRLHWDALTSTAPTDFSQFRFWYSTSEFSNCTSATSGGTSSDSSLTYKDLTGLTAGQNYYFCTTVKDEAGNESATTSRIKAFLLRDDTVTGLPASVVQGLQGKPSTSGIAGRASDFLSRSLFNVGGFSVTGGVVVVALLGYYFLVYKKKH